MFFRPQTSVVSLIPLGPERRDPRQTLLIFPLLSLSPIQSGDLISSQGGVHRILYSFTFESENINIWILGALIPLGQPSFQTEMPPGSLPHVGESPCNRGTAVFINTLATYTASGHTTSRGKAALGWGKAEPVLHEYAIIG